MPKIEIKPSDDKTEVTVNLDGVAIKANALQLDAIIEGLAAARAQLNPPVPNDAPLGQHVGYVPDPRYWTTLDQNTGATWLMLRHPGLGWVNFTLTPAERDRLTQYFTSQAKATSPVSGTATDDGSSIH